MANYKKVKTSFKKGEQRTIDAAKKSKRLPYDKTKQAFLQSTIKQLGIEKITAVCHRLGIDPKLNIDTVISIANLIQAMKGNVRAGTEERDRAYGKAKQPIDHSIQSTGEYIVKVDKLFKDV